MCGGLESELRQPVESVRKLRAMCAGVYVVGLISVRLPYVTLLLLLGVGVARPLTAEDRLCGN